jgi:hypothetical protein
VQAPDEPPQLGQRLLGLFVRLLDGPAGRLGRVGQLRPGHAQVHGQRDEPLLRTVVEVPFDASPLGVSRVDHTLPAGGERVDPSGQLLHPAGTEQAASQRDVERGQAAGHPRSGREDEKAERGQAGQRDRVADGPAEGPVLGQAP